MLMLPYINVKARYNSNKLMVDTSVSYTFYEEYFTIKTSQMLIKVFYGQIYNLIETNDNVYIYTSSNTCFIMVKNNIDSTFSNFIKNKVTCKYKKYNR